MAGAWYEPDDLWSDGSRLRANRRNEIEDAISKSKKHVAGLSDWVLVTRDKLGADDARWFNDLSDAAPFTVPTKRRLPG